MRNLLFALTALLMLSGCAMRTKILDTQAISTTHFNLKDGEKLQEIGPVTGKFCPDTFGDKGSIGLVDESVKSAQQKYQVDWILNASFWRSASCIELEGTGAKVVAGNTTPPAKSK